MLSNKEKYDSSFFPLEDTQFFLRRIFQCPNWEELQTRAWALRAGRVPQEGQGGGLAERHLTDVTVTLLPGPGWNVP